MEQAPEVIEVLQQIVGVTSDDERRTIEEASVRAMPYDSGLHDDDPLDQPEQTSEVQS